DPSRDVGAVIRPRCLRLAAALPLFLSVSGALARPPRAAPPTEDQFQEATEVCRSLGAELRKRIHPHAQQAAYVIVMPRSSVDADLEKIPDLPFSFGVDLFGTSVTDAGLETLVSLKNLTAIYLHGTRVTDAGLKAIGQFENLSTLNLAGCRRVTDEG